MLVGQIAMISTFPCNRCQVSKADLPLLVVGHTRNILVIVHTRTVAPSQDSQLHDPDPFHLRFTARMHNDQDVPCVATTRSGKSALLYLASVAGEGTNHSNLPD